MASDGASNNERLLAAAKSDNEDLLQEVFDKPGSFDINYQDGLGNTALHYAISNESDTVLEYILSHDGCDVDPTNKLEGATPLHLAVKLEEPEARVYFVRELLDAGADYTIRNKNGQTAQDLASLNDEEIHGLFRVQQAADNIAKDDIAYDDDDVASDGSD